MYQILLLFFGLLASSAEAVATDQVASSAEAVATDQVASLAEAVATDAKTLPPIEWSPNVVIPLHTDGLCVFTDQGYTFVVYNKTERKEPITQFDLTGLWSYHTVVPHEKAVIHVLKPAIPFRLTITPELNIIMQPILTGEPTDITHRTIHVKKSKNTLHFSGVHTNQHIQFVHDGIRIHAILTSRIDKGFQHHVDIRPYCRILPSIQGMAMQVDTPQTHIKTTPQSMSLSTPLSGYQRTYQNFWRFVMSYGKNDDAAERLTEPRASLIRAIQALYKGDGPTMMGILDYLKENNPRLSYHPLVLTLYAWAHYLLNRHHNHPLLIHFLAIDYLHHWTGFYEMHPFCYGDLVVHAPWDHIPEPICQRIGDHAMQIAHYQRNTDELQSLLSSHAAKYSRPLSKMFYQTVVAQVYEPDIYPDMLKKLRLMEGSASSCPQHMSSWIDYQNTDDHLATWSPFVPLWQLHREVGAAFQAGRYREVLTALAISPFNPSVSDVFGRLLNGTHISNVEKLSLYERFKNSLRRENCNQFVSNVIYAWLNLDLSQQAGDFLMANQSNLSDETRNLLWLSLAEEYVSQRAWSDLERALNQIKGEITESMYTMWQKQRAFLFWHTHRHDEAIKIWNTHSDTDLLEQAGYFLMQAERYKDAVSKWEVLINIKGQAVLKPYAICLWFLKDFNTLRLLQKTYMEDPWLQWVLEASDPSQLSFNSSMRLVEKTLKRAQKITA